MSYGMPDSPSPLDPFSSQPRISSSPESDIDSPVSKAPVLWAGHHVAKRLRDTNMPQILPDNEAAPSPVLQPLQKKKCSLRPPPLEKPAESPFSPKLSRPSSRPLLGFKDPDQDVSMSEAAPSQKPTPLKFKPQLTLDVGDDGSDQEMTPQQPLSPEHSNMLQSVLSDRLRPDAMELEETETEAKEATEPLSCFAKGATGTTELEQLLQQPNLTWEHTIGYNRLQEYVCIAPKFPNDFANDTMVRIAVTPATLKSRPGSYKISMDEYPASEGFQKKEGTPTWIFKPVDEVRGGRFHPEKEKVQYSKDGIRPEDEPRNELLTAVLHPNMNIPQSIPASLTAPGFYMPREGYIGRGKEPVSREGILIRYAPNATSLTDMKAAEREESIRRIPIQTTQNVAILDLRLMNTDRNLGNLLGNEITPIDHANILPSGFNSDGTFCWLPFPGVDQPFTEESLAQIQNLDFERDKATITQMFPDYPEDCLQTMEICDYLLKEGANAGLSPLQLACFLWEPTGGNEFTPIKALYDQAIDNEKDGKQLAGDRIPYIKEQLNTMMEAIKTKSPQIVDSLGEKRNSPEYPKLLHKGLKKAGAFKIN